MTSWTTVYDIETEVMFGPGQHIDVTARGRGGPSPGGTARLPP